MKASPLWAGEAFRNIHPVLARLRDPDAVPPSVSDFLCGGERRVPQGPLPSINPIPVLSRPARTSLRATWLGHSTVLIEIDGLRVLTDPVWGPRASPSRLVGPKRFQPVPVSLRDLLPLDVVVVSHDHYDHLDYPTVRELAKCDVPFVTSLGVGAHLESWECQPSGSRSSTGGSRIRCLTRTSRSLPRPRSTSPAADFTIEMRRCGRRLSFGRKIAPRSLAAILV